MMWDVTAAGLGAEICGTGDRLRAAYAAAFYLRCDEQMQRRVGARVRRQTCAVDGEALPFIVDIPAEFCAALGHTLPPETALLVVQRLAAEIAVALEEWLGKRVAGAVVPAGALRVQFRQIGGTVRCSGRLPVAAPEFPCP
jgi:hypothetical protein